MIIWKAAKSLIKNAIGLKEYRIQVIEMRFAGLILEKRMRNLMKLRGRTLPIRLKRDIHM